jgi:hypothetical protein
MVCLLGVSPKTSASFPAPAPTTTAPESMPILTEIFGFVGFWLSCDTASRIARPAVRPAQHRSREPLASRNRPLRHRRDTGRRDHQYRVIASAAALRYGRPSRAIPGVEPGCNLSRAHQITEHHSQMTPLAVGGWVWVFQLSLYRIGKGRTAFTANLKGGIFSLPHLVQRSRN